MTRRTIPILPVESTSHPPPAAPTPGPAPGRYRLSLATRIFLGYAVVLVTFGAVSIFSVAEMHRNQQEIRLVSQGYLHLSQDAAALETLQKSRVRDTARLLEEPNADARRNLVRLSRLYFPPLMAQRMSLGQERAREMLAFAPGSEADRVRELAGQLDVLDAHYREYEAILERVLRDGLVLPVVRVQDEHYREYE